MYRKEFPGYVGPPWGLINPYSGLVDGGSRGKDSVTEYELVKVVVEATSGNSDYHTKPRCFTISGINWKVKGDWQWR